MRWESSGGNYCLLMTPSRQLNTANNLRNSHEQSKKNVQISVKRCYARPHIAKETKRKLNELDWEVLPHPEYSPDLAPTDYHLFRKMANSFKEKSFDEYEHLKSEISDFFSSLKPEFFIKGIDELPVRWDFVVDNDGKYFID